MKGLPTLIESLNNIIESIDFINNEPLLNQAQSLEKILKELEQDILANNFSNIIYLRFYLQIYYLSHQFDEIIDDEIFENITEKLATLYDELKFLAFQTIKNLYLSQLIEGTEELFKKDRLDKKFYLHHDIGDVSNEKKEKKEVKERKEIDEVFQKLENLLPEYLIKARKMVPIENFLLNLLHQLKQRYPNFDTPFINDCVNELIQYIQGYKFDFKVLVQQELVNKLRQAYSLRNLFKFPSEHILTIYNSNNDPRLMLTERQCVSQVILWGKRLHKNLPLGNKGLDSSEALSPYQAFGELFSSLDKSTLPTSLPLKATFISEPLSLEQSYWIKANIYPIFTLIDKSIVRNQIFFSGATLAKKALATFKEIDNTSINSNDSRVITLFVKLTPKDETNYSHIIGIACITINKKRFIQFFDSEGIEFSTPENSFVEKLTHFCEQHQYPEYYNHFSFRLIDNACIALNAYDALVNLQLPISMNSKERALVKKLVSAGLSVPKDRELLYQELLNEENSNEEKSGEKQVSEKQVSKNPLVFSRVTTAPLVKSLSSQQKFVQKHHSRASTSTASARC